MKNRLLLITLIFGVFLIADYSVSFARSNKRVASRKISRSRFAGGASLRAVTLNAPQVPTDGGKGSEDEPEDTEKVAEFSPCFQGYRYCMDKEISYSHINYPDISKTYEGMIGEYYEGNSIPPFRCFFSSSIKSLAIKKMYGVPFVSRSKENFVYEESVMYYKDLMKQIKEYGIGTINSSALNEKILVDLDRRKYKNLINKEAENIMTVPINVASLDGEELFKQADEKCSDLSKNDGFYKGCKSFHRNIKSFYLGDSVDVAGQTEKEKNFVGVQQSCKDFTGYLKRLLEKMPSEYEKVLNANSVSLKKQLEYEVKATGK